MSPDEDKGYDGRYKRANPRADPAYPGQVQVETILGEESSRVNGVCLERAAVWRQSDIRMICHTFNSEGVCASGLWSSVPEICKKMQGWKCFDRPLEYDVEVLDDIGIRNVGSLMEDINGWPSPVEKRMRRKTTAEGGIDDAEVEVGGGS